METRNADPIRFANPNFKPEWIAQMLDSMEKALKSGWLTTGENVRSVERFFSDYLGRKDVIATNSCTAALHIALQLVGVKKRTEVIVPSETFAATANSVLYNQGTPVFAEIDPRTMNIDPSDVERRITKRTAAIVVVHVAGLPCDMDAITRISQEHDIPIVEDCAHAHGAKYHGQPCGSFGEYACFSFYPTKVIGGAEGGLVVAPDSDQGAKARRLVNQGRGGFGPEEITEIGYNYRMNELQACVLLPQLPEIDRIVDYRNMLAREYADTLSGLRDVELLDVPAGVRHSYYSFMVKVPMHLRNGVIDELKKKGVETSILYHPVHLQPAYRRLFGYSTGHLPLTEDSCARIISLPMHTGLSPQHVRQVASRLAEILNEMQR